MLRCIKKFCCHISDYAYRICALIAIRSLNVVQVIRANRDGIGHDQHFFIQNSIIAVLIKEKQ